MNHYQVALATGLTPEKAKFFATAMTHSNAPDLNHFYIINEDLTKTAYKDYENRTDNNKLGK